MKIIKDNYSLNWEEEFEKVNLGYVKSLLNLLESKSDRVIRKAPSDATVKLDLTCKEGKWHASGKIISSQIFFEATHYSKDPFECLNKVFQRVDAWLPNWKTDKFGLIS